MCVPARMGFFALAPPCPRGGSVLGAACFPSRRAYVPPVVLYYLWVDARVARVFVRGVRLPIPS